MPSHPRVFLSQEQAQVWALDRVTAEPVYLPRGQAEAMQPRARVSLKCPHPDCFDEISARGGTKRDGFFHLNTPKHETGRESEFHLAGKAMLAQWLTSVIPDGAVAEEEVTVKDPATAVHRRADVIVTGASGRQVAYEVEYKSFAVEDWKRKQADYETQKVVCLWLVGHTRVNLFLDSDGRSEGVAVPVTLPALAAEIAAREPRVPLLVLNPVTREVGTLSGDHNFTTWYRGDTTVAYLRIDDLDECTFDTRLGIVTPQMCVIAHNEEKRRQAEAVAEEGRRQQEHRWKASPVRTKIVTRWRTVPSDFSLNAGDPSSIFALPEHWRAVIHEELVHDRTETFGWREVFAALDRHKIVRVDDDAAVYNTIGAWMLILRHWDLLARFDSHLRLRAFTPTGRTFEEVWEARAAAAQARLSRADEVAEAVRRRSPAHIQKRMRFTDIEPGQSVSENARTKLVVDADGTRRWVRKDV